MLPLYTFLSDYSETSPPDILAARARAAGEQNPGYGLDPHSVRAAELLRGAMDCPQADIHFLVGGTPCNQILISAALRPHQAVIAAATGHVNVHETGAIEATGHKVLTLPAPDGKVTPAMVEAICAAHTDEHMVKPGLVYLSDSTELGTIYTKAELSALSRLCREKGLLLYLDGARLGCALAAEGNDLTLADLPQLCDAFYIGGTKNGALFGEAMVLINPALKRDFRYLIKQRGGMLAKGFLTGMQFEALFQDGLYFRLADHADRMAQKLKAGMLALGYPQLADSPTNQLFFVLPNAVCRQLEGIVMPYLPADDGHTSIRLVTSWATPETAVDDFLARLSALT